MRIFIFLSFFITASAFAQTFEERMEQLQKEHQERLFQVRRDNQFAGTYPAPKEEYVTQYAREKDKFLEETIKLHQEFCSKTPSSNCLTEADVKLRTAQNNIDKGLVQRKQQWGKERLSEEVVRQREAEYQREQNINLCAEHGKCDGLSEQDRAIASERSKDQGNVKPEVEVKPDVEVKPEVDVNTETDVKPDTDAETEKTPEEEKAEVEAKLEADLKALTDAYNSEYPNAETEVTAESLAALKILEAAKLEKTFEAFEALCAKYPDKEEMCLDDTEKEIFRDISAGFVCLAERKHKGKSPDQSTHEAEWNSLPAPKSCQTLIDKDKEVPKEEVPATNDDENNPRNYDPKSCEWVTDLPKKIVNAPGCGRNSRSRVCTGYVVCNQKSGGGKFVRMSTCRPEYCGNAVRCTEDMRYFSEKPWDENKLFVSPKLKQILTKPAGTTEQ